MTRIKALNRYQKAVLIVMGGHDSDLYGSLFQDDFKGWI